MARRAIFALLTAIVLVAAPGAARASAESIYVDTAGLGVDCAPGTDSGVPYIDIRTVTVSNDPGAGTVTFAIRLTGAPSLSGGAMLVLGVIPGRSGSSRELTVEANDSGAALRGGGAVASSYAGGVMTIDLAAAAIHAGSAFRFQVDSVPAFSQGQSFCEDAAPNSTKSASTWTYTMSTAPPKRQAPAVESLATQLSAAPMHGASFAVTGMVATLSDGTRTAASNLVCSAMLVGTKVKGTGAGGCRFKLAKSAAKKTIVLTTSGTLSGVTVTRTDILVVA